MMDDGESEQGNGGRRAGRGILLCSGRAAQIENSAMLNINRERCLRAQKERLDAGAVEYAFTTDETHAEPGVGGNYELIKEMQDKYGGEWRMFRLYRKMGADM